MTGRSAAPRVVKVPLLERFPWLVHGFGTGAWGEEDLAADADLGGFRPVIMRQTHSDVVHRVEAPPASRLVGDALITRAPGLLLVVRTADCLPVLLADGEKRAVASVHCGWRGTRARILERTIGGMAAAFGSKPARLVAALGPCIGPACYEVGPEVEASFREAGFPAAVFRARPGGPEGGRAFLDLRAANAWLLEQCGVPPAHIAGVEACTHCDPRLLSYRRSKGEPRRMYNFIGIRTK
ncbi:MAG: peptidoglycan editing factor PgeF [Acidobacteriota bacterium]